MQSQRLVGMTRLLGPSALLQVGGREMKHCRHFSSVMEKTGLGEREDGRGGSLAVGAVCFCLGPEAWPGRQRAGEPVMSLLMRGGFPAMAESVPRSWVRGGGAETSRGTGAERAKRGRSKPAGSLEGQEVSSPATVGGRGSELAGRGRRERLLV